MTTPIPFLGKPSFIYLAVDVSISSNIYALYAPKVAKLNPVFNDVSINYNGSIIFLYETNFLILSNLSFTAWTSSAHHQHIPSRESAEGAIVYYLELPC